MIDERRFTLDEASAELEALRERLPRLRAARHALIAASERIQEAVAADGGGVEGTDWYRAQSTLREELEWVIERGIVLRDPETGLVDFPSERDGDEIYLCWRLGEPTIAWYHTRTAGFTGRKPL
jgi:hypothetical protein